MNGNNIDPVVLEAYRRECDFNKFLLPQLRVHFSVPLIVLLRSMKTTRIIALTILMMLSGQSPKIIKLFDKDLYYNE